MHRSEPYKCSGPVAAQESVLWSVFDTAVGAITADERGFEALGPCAALKAFKQRRLDVSQTNNWLEVARLEAVLGSCRGSWKSVRSGLRLYIAFVQTLVGPGADVSLFPPRIEWLQAWAQLFRSHRTFKNYLGFVTTGCMLVKVSVDVFSSPEVVRAKNAIAKSGKFRAREKMWIRRSTVVAMVQWASTRPELAVFAHLFLVCYAFLLRLPSEGLPMMVASCEEGATGQSTIIVGHDELVLILARRKNKPQGSRLVRKCWCRECALTCPVHVLGPVFKAWPVDIPLFKSVTAAAASKKLREMLKAVGVQGSATYRTHDLRRGHALDLQLSGAPLWQILQAGEWTSPAFLKYLDLHRLDTDFVVQAHAGESDSEEEEVPE